jgi:hypothetical protein
VLFDIDSTSEPVYCADTNYYSEQTCHIPWQ